MTNTAVDGRTYDDVVRVVFPVQDSEHTLPLYAIDWTRPHLPKTVLDPRIDSKTIPFNSMNLSTFEELIHEGATWGTGQECVTTEAFNVLSRTSIQVKRNCKISLCTYFNAFPAGYWRRWTKVDTVRLSASASGQGRLIVNRSNGRGLHHTVASIDVNSSQSKQTQEIHVDIPMAGLVDGGYFWIDLESAPTKELTLTRASWQVPLDTRTTKTTSSLSIAITTFNRAEYCMRQLRDLASATELRDRLDTIYCTDQGTDLVCQQQDFATIEKQLGNQLTYITQHNLGGSGGFSRGMYETVQAGKSDYVLFLDDDAICEPESILRSIQFADYAFKTMLVGGGMLHLDNRTVLYTQGERVDWKRMWMRPSQSMEYNHDFANKPLHDSPELHQRIDEDFNGWWMCLIPVKVIKTVGLSLPIFIKFDDLEYSVRAQEAGFPTVSLPGVAVWHQAWHEKDPARTWEEYFTERNRWITALLHEPRKPVSRVIFETLYGDMSLGFRFTYSAMALRNLALRDLLRGPQYIVDCFPNKLDQVRQLRSKFPDAQPIQDLTNIPDAAREIIPPRRHPTNRKYRLKTATKLLAQSLLTNRSAKKSQQPDAVICAQDAAWTWLAFDSVDSALVTSPDGNSVTWLKRDNPTFRKYFIEGYKLASAVRSNWTSLSYAYRTFGLSSFETWQSIFKDSQDNKQSDQPNIAQTSQQHSKD
jgi:galactofuranosylgalactofuranosylrhamnosyl-N-acetylglucosaminyl-diphospho-decaprenol beta-1,5/1,6-galactofuranosyltransferase